VSDPVTRILFVDTANSSRSILAEALVRRAGGERFVAVVPPDRGPDSIGRARLIRR